MGSLPLGIDIPAEIWLLAGIVIGPTIGTSIVTSVKRRKRMLRQAPNDPPISDMFLYEDIGASDRVDFSAAYDFLVKIAIFVGYLVALGHMMYVVPPDTAIAQFPAISGGLLVIAAGVSGVYVASRAITR